MTEIIFAQMSIATLYLLPSIHSFLFPQGTVATINCDFCCKGHLLQKPADCVIEIFFSLVFLPLVLHLWSLCVHPECFDSTILNNANQALTPVKRKTCYDK